MSWKVSGQIGRYQVPDLALHCLGVRMSCDHVGADAGTHTFHAFAPDWIEGYKGLGGAEYQAAKEAAADEIIDRLEAACFPGLRNAIVLREVRRAGVTQGCEGFGLSLGPEFRAAATCTATSSTLGTA